MVKLQEAENQINVDYEVYTRRPNDGRHAYRNPGRSKGASIFSAPVFTSIA
jgi:hypothetical protein